jgi:hypothetical protein
MKFAPCYGLMTTQQVAIRTNDEPLRTALERLEGCLTAPLDGYTQSWAVRVGWQLAEVEAALNQPNDSAETTVSTFVPGDVEGPKPDLSGSRFRDHLHSQSEHLRQELQAVAQPFADSPKTIDLLEIRRRIRQLINDIQRYKEGEAILLLEKPNLKTGD